ncbi:MAG TPA: pyrroline-5-carboxylate reductase [Bryobacteraceae bacterium]|nr:pyrroline-5-carboxylate reductase [Bryobacteraceae bacterium]
MKIAVLGAGNMGSALLGGMLKAGVVVPEDVRATTKTEPRAAALRATLGVAATAGGNFEAAKGADLVVLAVKPGTVPKVVKEIRDILEERQILISLAAALPLSVIQDAAACRLPVFRAMPNIPVVVGEGAIGICHNSLATEEHRDLVGRIFGTVGLTAFVDEEQMDAVTALSGSGPAYVYMVIEAMMAAGVKMGLPRDVSLRLAEQTVLGASRHARSSNLHPAILRDQVITPGGTTIAAIHELERHGLRSMLISAIETATIHAGKRTEALLADIERQKHT